MGEEEDIDRKDDVSSPTRMKPIHMLHRSSALYKHKTIYEQQVVDEISTISLDDSDDHNLFTRAITSYHAETPESPVSPTNRSVTLGANFNVTQDKRKRSHVVHKAISPRNYSDASTNSSGSPYATPRGLTAIYDSVVQQQQATSLVDEIMISPESSLKSLVIKTATDQKYGYLTVNQIFEFGLRYAFEEDGFVQMFLCTYKTFISPKLIVSTMSTNLQELMTKLEFGFEKNQSVARCCNLLAKWSTQCFSDFLFDKQIHEELFTFMGTLESHLSSSEHNYETVQENVIKMCQKVAKVISEHEDQDQKPNIRSPNVQEAPKPIVLKSVPDPTRLKIADVHPLELARQLTLMEFDMFAKVSSEELLGLGWTKDSKEWTAPNITKIISWTNTMTNWITTCILKEAKIKERQKVLRIFLDVCEACYEFKNFNTLFEIMMALVAHPVHRLKLTKEGLPKKYKDLLIKFDNVTSFMGNRRAYREEMKQIDFGKTPCMPFVGVSLTDLVFFDQGNANHQIRGEAMYINLSKRSQMALVVNLLMKAQTKPYHFVQVDYIQKFICWETNTNVVSDEALLDKISKSLE